MARGSRGRFAATATVEERFWPKVRKTHRCWDWLANTSTNGYGQFWCDGRLVAAHRWAYERFMGPVPDGLELDHLCRNPACVNPDHLEPVSHRENSLRGTNPTAQNARKTHCKRGHEFTPENTRVYIDAHSGREARECRQCTRERKARRYR